MTALKIASDLHRVSAIYSVRFALDGASLSCEWFPRRPSAREMNLLLGKYRAARQEFLKAIAAESGQNVTCLELSA